jgi:hypothetical protein
MRKKWIWLAPLAIIATAAFVAIGGEVVRLLWNWLLPMLFGWHPITFWQAVGILALCRILFGSHGFRGPMRSNMRRRMRERMEERYAAMTPEERERFRQSWRGPCGFGPSTGESTGQ